MAATIQMVGTATQSSASIPTKSSSSSSNFFSSLASTRVFSSVTNLNVPAGIKDGERSQPRQRLSVRAAGTKKSGSHVEHHKDGAPQKLPPRLGLRHVTPDDDVVSHMKLKELVLGGHGGVFGSRIPKHYFMTKGFGETDQGDGSDPWETGSYDLALEDAGIQDLNITKYTSVIPPESEAVSLEEARPFLRHGAVMESIMSIMHGVKGDRITAGVGRVQIRRKKDKFHIGGYAAEYEGHASADVAKDILRKDLTSIVERRFDLKEYETFEEDYIIQEGEVTKSFGSVLASICFVTYVLPMYVSN